MFDQSYSYSLLEEEKEEEHQSNPLCSKRRTISIRALLLLSLLKQLVVTCQHVPHSQRKAAATYQVPWYVFFVLPNSSNSNSQSYLEHLEL